MQAQSGQVAPPMQEKLGPATPVDTTTAYKLSNTFRSAADRALPAVVAIQVESRPQMTAQGRGSPQQVPEQFRRFFEQFGYQVPEDGQLPPQRGLGSGFILDEAGHIMTNQHVVNGADRITVHTRDGQEYDAKLVGSDSNTDVAIIKITPKRGETLPVSRLGDSDRLQVGDWVLALGNPLGFNFTVTAGIVSAKGRQLQRGNETALEAYVQTDAAINPGNSGGPLVDLMGRVVAMNTAIEGPSFIGYGFSVPIDLAKRVADDLIKQGYVRRPRIGVRIQDVRAVDAEVYGLKDVSGALVMAVEDGEPAARAGVQPGDVVVALNGRKIDNATDLTTSLARMQPGDNVQLTIWRNKQERTISVRLGEFERSGQTETAASNEGAHAERLGFEAEAITPQLARQYQLSESSGLVVTSVAQYGPAAQRGVREGQVLLSIDGQQVNTPAQLARIAGTIKADSPVALRVRDPEYGVMVINYRAQ